MMLKMYPLVLLLSLPTCVLVTDIDYEELLNEFKELSTTVTGQTYLFVGDDLSLNCTLSEKFLQNFTAHNISFIFQFEARHPNICMPVDNIKVVDTNVASLVIENVTVNNSGPYVCNVGREGCQNGSDGDFETVGTSGDVKIEYPPHNVTNFHCVVYNWDELMNCTWQHPVDYKNWSNIEVSIVYAIPQHAKPVLAYKYPDPNRNGCFWDQTNFSPADPYYVEVTVKNKENNASASKVFRVNTSSLVQPYPVENLSIRTENDKPECLFLSWNHSRKHQQKVYRIRRKAVTDDKFHVLKDNVSDTSFIDCGYLPYTLYNFSVECYPTSIYSGYWSDPVYASTRTLMTAPKLGPQMTNGSFMTTDCVDRERNVTLMWQEVESSAQNGIIDGFIIKLGDRTLKNVLGDARSAKIELPCYQTSELSVLAHNEGGYSLNPSVLLIPPVYFSVSKVLEESFSVEVMLDKYPEVHVSSLRAVWEVGEGAENLNYTIFWCEGLPGPVTSCTGKINWSKVSGVQTHYNISISSSDAGIYLFGISQTDIHAAVTSGIFWAKCLFNHNPSRLKHVHIQDLNVDSGVKKVQVTWSKIECNYQSRVKVTSYLVKACEADRCNETQTFYEVPATHYMYTVSGLEANVKYSFTVQPKFYDNVGDEVIPWKDALSNESEDPTWIIPVLVGVLIPVSIIVLAVWIYLRCKKGRKKMEGLTSEQAVTLEKGVPRIPQAPTSLMSQSLSARNDAVTLMTESSVTYAKCSDSGCPNVAVSPQSTIPAQNISELSDWHLPNGDDGQESSSHEPAQSCQSSEYNPLSQSTLNFSSSQLSDHHGRQQHSGRVGQESVTANPESVQSYQHFAFLPSNQLSEPSEGQLQDGSSDQESVSSSHEPAQSYQRFAYIPLSKSSDLQDRQQQNGSLSQESSYSESVQSYQNLSYTPSNELTDTQIDLLSLLANIHPSNTVMSPAVSHLRSERDVPLEVGGTKDFSKTGLIDLEAIHLANVASAPDKLDIVAITVLDSDANLAPEINVPNTQSGQSLSVVDVELNSCYQPDQDQTILSSVGTTSSQFNTSQTSNSASPYSAECIQMTTFGELDIDSDSNS